MDFKRQDSLATHASLLERLRDLGDQESWQQFYAAYRRLIFSFALRHGLSSTEAEEVVQETVITVARNLPEYRYDPARCSFKTWLFTLTLWRIRDQIRKRHPKEDSLDRLLGECAPGNATQNLVQAEVDRVSALWEEEWKKDLLERALEKVRAKVDEKHFQVFDLYVMQHWPVYKVAHCLGVSRASVYVIKHRVSGLLRKELEHME